MADENKNKNFREDHEVSLVEGLPRYETSGGTEELSLEDMNSTMMGMDLKSLQNETKQNIRVDMSVSEKNDSGQIKTKSRFSDWLILFKNRFQKKKPSKPIEGENTPHDFRFAKRMQGWQGVWLAFQDDQLWQKTFFYLSRILILCLWAVSYFILAQVVLHSQIEMHPARWFLTTVVSVTFASTLLSLFFKRLSPVWLVSLPLTAFAIIFAYGLLWYGSYDTHYFVFKSYKMAQLFNGYYFLIFVFLLSLFWGGLTRRVSGYILWTVLCTLSLFAPVYHGALQLDFEMGLFRFGALSKIQDFYLLPAFIFLHALIPLWLILIFVKACSKSTNPKMRSSRSAYWALLPLFVSLLFLSVGLLQNNRVFHVGNFVWPQKMWQGQAQWSIMGHPVKLTSAYDLNSSSMYSHDKYNFFVRPSTHPKSYEVEVYSQYGQKILGLMQSDIHAQFDGVLSSDFQWFAHASEAGVYIFKTDLKARDQVLSFNATKKVWTQSEELVLDIVDPQRIAKIDILENGQVIAQKQAPFAEKVGVDLKYFTTGEHSLTVVAYASKEQELLRLPIKIAVQESHGFSVVSPFENDDIGDQLSVVLALKGIKEADVRSVRYQINNTILFESKTFPSFITLSTKDFSPGDLTLTVKLKLDSDEWEHVVPLKKSTGQTANLKLISPAQGAFATKDTHVAYEIESKDATQVLGVKVKVNGLIFDDFEVKDKGFILPASRWKSGEVYVSLQATLDSGKKVSDWVQINRGQSALKMQFTGASFLNFGKNKNTFIIDSSHDSSRFWFKDSLLNIFKQVLLLPEINSKFGEDGLTIVTLGGDKPLYYHNCSAVETVFDGSAQKPLIKKSLDSVLPQGQRPLNLGLKTILKNKPSDVILLLSGRDTCGEDTLSSLGSFLESSPKTRLSVFWFGEDLTENEEKQWVSLLQKNEGHFYQPENYENFIKLFADELSVHFMISDTEKTILKEPLKDAEFNLPPGDYILHLPLSQGVREVPLHLEHGLKKTLLMSIKDSKIVVEESESPL